jgi:hypothetical protein
MKMNDGRGEEKEGLGTDEIINHIFRLKRQQMQLRREMEEKRAHLAAADRDNVEAERSAALHALRAHQNALKRRDESAWTSAHIVDPSLRRGYSSVPDPKQHTEMRASSTVVAVDIRTITAMLARQQQLMQDLNHLPILRSHGKPVPYAIETHACEQGMTIMDGPLDAHSCTKGLLIPEALHQVEQASDKGRTYLVSDGITERQHAEVLQQQVKVIESQLMSKLEAVTRTNAQVKQLQVYLREIQEDVLLTATSGEKHRRHEIDIELSIKSTTQSAAQLRVSHLSECRFSKHHKTGIPFAPQAL